MEPASRSRRGTETRQKQTVVGFRATAEERAEIGAAAELAGVTPSEYIRSRVLAHPAKRPPRVTRQPRADVVALARLQGEMNKVGSNIHQLVKRVNFGETPTGVEVREAFAGYREVIAAILAALGRVPR